MQRKTHGISLRRRTIWICCQWKSLAVREAVKWGKKRLVFCLLLGYSLNIFQQQAFVLHSFHPAYPQALDQLPASVSLSATLIPQDLLCCRIPHLAQIVWRTHIVHLQLTFFFSPLLSSSAELQVLPEGSIFTEGEIFASHWHKSNPASFSFFKAKPIILIMAPGPLYICKYVTYCLPPAPGFSY